MQNISCALPPLILLTRPDCALKFLAPAILFALILYPETLGEEETVLGIFRADEHSSVKIEAR